MIPIISPTGEEVRRVSDTRIEIVKPDGTVVIQCNVPMSIKKTEKDRVFNMVPGAEAVPIIVPLAKETDAEIRCTISVI